MKSNRAIFFSGLVIVLTALAAYHNSFHVPFVFDDEHSILGNPTIHQLWPLSGPLSPPPDHGFTVSGRPLLNLSLALNYAVSGTEPWSYHVLNLLIHMAAGLGLFGLVRRTLGRLPSASPAGLRLRELALPTALVVALLWTLHPVQTESVTYVIQRAESLMGFFYLLTLYGFVRYTEPGGDVTWGWLSFFACLLGMATKEVMVTAPLLVLLYDRVFLSGGFVAAWRRRRGYYASLASTWGLLVVLVASTGGDRGGTFKLSAGAFGTYWLTQLEAFTRYLGLALWPHPLVFEYGVVTNQNPWAIVGFAGLTAVFLGLVVALWRRSPSAAFGLVGFLVILAPTSLMPGAMQVIVEHRLYLPLAGLIASLFTLLVVWQGRRGLVVGLILALSGGVLTELRNRDYQTELALWLDTLKKRPGNAKVENNLGRVRYARGEIGSAISHYQESIRLDPSIAQPYFNLGLALEEVGRVDEAMGAYHEAVKILPYFAHAHARWGILLAKAGRSAEAGEHLFIAHSYAPDMAEVHLGLGLLLAAAGNEAGAQEEFIRVLALHPKHAEARLGLGVSLARQGRPAEALVHLRQLVQEAPAMPEAHENLGIVLAESGDPAAAVLSYAKAVPLQPENAKIHYNFGNALVRLQRWGEAKTEFETAVRLEPDFAAAKEMLAKFQERGGP